MKWMIIIPLLLLTGCINITTQLQPINPAVKATITGKDCTPIFAGLGYGVNTVEQAVQNGLTRHESQGYAPMRYTPITKIHSLALTEMTVLIFGERCIKVVGE